MPIFGKKNPYNWDKFGWSALPKEWKSFTCSLMKMTSKVRATWTIFHSSQNTSPHLIALQMQQKLRWSRSMHTRHVTFCYIGQFILIRPMFFFCSDFCTTCCLCDIDLIFNKEESHSLRLKKDESYSWDWSVILIYIPRQLFQKVLTFNYNMKYFIYPQWHY